jgi:hypothetical protein
VLEKEKEKKKLYRQIALTYFDDILKKKKKKTFF